ncbi:hypothetical protein OG21DRAFT_1498562 [Imleria badia]|nr:hypothetical protein OG21DRAFT_1498562 [Imleria badia]
MALGPSRVAARASRRDDVDDGVGSDADRRLLADLRCVANRRRVFLFEGDAVMLRQLCAEHGMDPQSSDDVRRCFHWLVKHLFSGDCAAALDTLTWMILS